MPAAGGGINSSSLRIGALLLFCTDAVGRAGCGHRIDTIQQLKLICCPLLAGRQHQLERCIAFTRIQEGDPRFLTDPARPGTLLLTFTPKVALTAILQLLVSRAGGGQWKIDIHLEALQPDIDGLVRMLTLITLASRIRCIAGSAVP